MVEKDSEVPPNTILHFDIKLHPLEDHGVHVSNGIPFPMCLPYTLR
jgi:hypothetical protein